MKITMVESPAPITENPFWIDQFSMGQQIGQDVFMMYSNHSDQPLQPFYLYNIKTGQRWDLIVEGS